MGSDWREVSLGEVCKIRRGSSPRPIVDFLSETEGMPWVKIADATESNSRFIEKTNQFIKEEGVCKSVIVEKGDLILSNSGTAGLPKFMSITACIHDGWQVLKDLEGITSDYLYYSLLYIRLLLLHNANDSTMKNLTLDMVRDAKIDLPPLPEQKAIAHILGSLDDKIELNRRMNATLEGMAQALFKSWFVDFDPVIDNALAAGNPIPDELAERAEVRRKALANGTANREAAKPFPAAFQQTEEMGWIPDGWEVLPLDQVAEFKNGLALQKFRPKPDEDPLPIVKIAQLKTGEATWDELASPSISADCIIDDGDVVFSWSGSLMIDVWCGGKAALNQHLFKVTSDNLPKWLYLKWSEEHLNNFQKIAADKAVTMGHIKRSHLSEALCAVPGSDFIKLGAEHFDPILERIVSNRLHGRSLTKLRDTLLPKLISGEVRLEDAEKMVQEKIT